MSHHAYFTTGEAETGIERALEFIARELNLTTQNNPDVTVFRYGLLSVEHSRILGTLAAQAPTVGERKVLIVSAQRLFHEAQNALLKLFEEPSEGTTLIVVIPSEGLLLPTLRSRLLPLPKLSVGARSNLAPDISEQFVNATHSGRKKIIEKLLERSKSDKDEEKQAARREAIVLAEGMARTTHGIWQTATGSAQTHELALFLEDLEAFIPILHERSAPLKLIFEHLLLTIPESVKAVV